MLTKKQLLKTPEYWIEEIQNQIYREVKAYMELHELNQIQLAKEWGVSKGYITQILNGECNFSIKKLVELSLKMGKVPLLEYKYLQESSLPSKIKKSLTNSRSTIIRA